jgi:phenolic acid decarboxylase
MRTNYYLKINDKILHIGKSSSGWKFLFRRYKDIKICNVDDWLDLIENNKNGLYNEYKEQINFDEFNNLIMSKTNEKNNRDIETDGNFDYLDVEFS